MPKQKVTTAILCPPIRVNTNPNSWIQILFFLFGKALIKHNIPMWWIPAKKIRIPKMMKISNIFEYSRGLFILRLLSLSVKSNSVKKIKEISVWMNFNIIMSIIWVRLLSIVTWSEIRKITRKISESRHFPTGVHTNFKIAGSSPSHFQKSAISEGGNDNIF